MNLRNGFLGTVVALLMVMILSLTPALADPPADGSKVSHPRDEAAEHGHKDKEKGKERFRQEKLP